MEYCFGAGDGSATMWIGTPDTDLDGDGALDALRLDFDGDGLVDDAIGDLDGDGLADHAALDLDDDGRAESYFTDDGSGTWAVAVDRGGGLRWFGLDGVEHTGGPLVDFDADGQADDQVIDTDGNGLADRALCDGPSGALGYVDTDGDGRWDAELADTDGDGTRHGETAVARQGVCIFVCMARLNVYVPDELAEQARTRGLNVSALTQAAIAAELARTAMHSWLNHLPAISRNVEHDAVMAALDAARDEFGR